jgi:dephospho-CoA kinase
VRRIGLTGGIATGKTHVAKRFRAAGVPVVDADILAREAVALGTPGLAAIVSRFGNEILTPSGTLDRARLGDIVFRDREARRALEAIIHPTVRAGMDEFFSSLPTSTPFAIADVPLLFETGRAHDFDAVIVATCGRDTQIERVMARDGLSREQAEQRVAAQLPMDEKVKQADYVINTDGAFAETDRQVDTVITRLRTL